MDHVQNASDIQGLLINGYKHHIYSTHMIFQFGAGSQPADFIKALYPHVQSAADWGAVRPASMLNIALTATGIAALKGYNIDPATSQFGPTFCAGPASAMSQSSLFDLGESDPSKWLFGNNTPQPISDYEQISVECMVHVYGITPDNLTTLEHKVAEAAKAAGLTEIFPINPGKRLQQCHLPTGVVHFGYLDGIDNPTLDPSVPILPFSNTDPQNLNNFLVGYHGGSSYFRPGPTGHSDESKFAHNGFYNAFRMISQDLKGFEDFLNDQAQHVAPQIGMDTAFAKKWLAAKLVGRWQDGSPLELAPDAPDPALSRATDFGYNKDQSGLRCPITAHTRVVNPRDTTMTAGNTPVPRILRRGVPYGASLGDPDYDGQSGLVGMFIVGSLSDQFEIVSGWMNRNNFTPQLAAQYPSTQDALLANRQVGTTTQAFPIPLSITNPHTNPPTTADITPAPILPQFITTRGSAYTFFPSMSALKSCFS